ESGCDKAMHARLRGDPGAAVQAPDTQAGIRLRHQGYLGRASSPVRPLILCSPGRPPYRMFYYGAEFARGAQRPNGALMADLRFQGQADMGDSLVSDFLGRD